MVPEMLLHIQLPNLTLCIQNECFIRVIQHFPQPVLRYSKLLENEFILILLHSKHWLAMCNIQICNIALILQCQYSTALPVLY